MRPPTIGFTGKTAERFFTLLRDPGSGRGVDTRLNNVSRLADFAKRRDPARFPKAVRGGMGYEHWPDPAPTKELLDDRRKRRIDWPAHEARFLDLMRRRRVERAIPKEAIADGRPPCGEDKPRRRHRWRNT